MPVPVVLLLALIAASCCRQLPAATLQTLLDSAPAGAGVGLALRRCADDAELIGVAATTPRRLASVTKLCISAAALLDLRPDYRFVTELVGLGPVVDGHLPTLGIRGGGDPCLDEHFTDKDPDRIFRDWAQALREQGINSIGEVVVDASLFSGPIRPPTYPRDANNLQKWYSAPASAFAWNDNCIEARVLPQDPGQPCRIEIRPHSPRVTVDNNTESRADGGRRGILISRAADANLLRISGAYSRATSWYPLAIHDSPNLLAADHLRFIFDQQGLPVASGSRLQALAAETPLLHRHRSPLLPALAILNQRSQNFYGEQLLRLLGHRHSGTGSIAAGTQAVTAILRQRLELELGDLSLLDGSGLSYDNRASAREITRLLAAMQRHEHGHHFQASLKDLWHGHIRGKVKTGSLAIVRSLAGYIPGDDGHTYAFCILLERGEATSIGWATRLRDKLFRTLVEQVADHRRAPSDR